MYFSQAFKGQNQWWKYLLIPFLIFCLNLFLTMLIVVVFQMKGHSEQDILFAFETYDFLKIGIDTNLGVVLMIFPLTLSFFFLVILIRKMHRFNVRQIFTAYKNFRWKRMFMAMLLWFIILVMAETVSYFIDPEVYEINLDFRKLLPSLLIGLLLIPFQAAFEELLFRGYLMQGIGLLFRNRWLALLLTSIFFGAMHYMNPEVQQFGLVKAMSFYILFGLFMGLMVVLDGGLELAIGIHVINNFYSVVFVNYSGSVLKTSSLLTNTEQNPDLMLPLFTLSAILFTLIAIRKRKEGFRRLLLPIIKAEE